MRSIDMRIFGSEWMVFNVSWINWMISGPQFRA